MNISRFRLPPKERRFLQAVYDYNKEHGIPIMTDEIDPVVNGRSHYIKKLKDRKLIERVIPGQYIITADGIGYIEKTVVTATPVSIDHSVGSSVKMPDAADLDELFKADE